MAFVNILSIPGVTYTLRYKQAAGAGEVLSPADPITISGSSFVIPAQFEWGDVEVEITSFGTAVGVITGRITVTAATFDGGLDPYGFNIVGPHSTLFATGGTNYGSSPASGSESGTSNLANPFMGLKMGTTGSLTGGSFIIELDGSFPTPEFWKDFAGTREEGTLLKVAEPVVVHEVVGQPYIPPTEQCATVYPPPPGPGNDGSGSLGGGNGGGNSGGGNGPPSGGCTTVGDTTCCLGPPGSEMYCYFSG